MADSATGKTAGSASVIGMGDAAQRLIRALGVDMTALPPTTRAAIQALAGEVMALRQERIDLQAQIAQVEQLADRDALCPVFNRRAFERELNREIALSIRYGSPLCLVFIDLDRFKQINDRFGHATGDNVLKQVADTLLANIRQTDILGRLGGDEFGIALTHAEFADSQIKADQLTGLIDGMLVRDASDAATEPVRLGASCGVVEWRKGVGAPALIAEADETMFRVKAARRKRP